MSDYSPPASPNEFDDLEDLLYDADPAPDLADELAQHTLHSPLLYAQDFDPGYELQEYFSDWEYYSDDYYDDDPDILKKYPIDGEPPKKKSSTQTDQKGRGKKRKAAEAELEFENPIIRERRFLKDCMKGTVWATPAPVKDNVYLQGQDEKVALLKDWRERFGNASPRKDDAASSRKTPKLPSDESWANDLSLADMGLMNARGNTVASGATEGGEDGGDEEDQDLEGPGDAAANGIDLADLDDLDFDEEALALLKAAAESAAQGGGIDLSKLNLPIEQQEALRAVLTHRSRTQSPEQEQSHQSRRSDAQVVPQPEEEVTQALPARKRPRKNPPKHISSQTIAPPSPPPSSANATTEASAVTNSNARKRKASSPPPSEPDLSATNDAASTTNSQHSGGTSGRATKKANGAKRVASVANNVTSARATERVQGNEAAGGGGGRVTRSRKR